MTYDFNEHMKDTILNINNSNRMLAKAARQEERLNEQHQEQQAAEDEDMMGLKPIDLEGEYFEQL
tara:strand:- start:83 stop:277 length:195 start_codon:yes stop_codon:yes gene_type:complete